MGKTGTSIIKCDVKELIELLNKALADEWLAYYQYWIGAKIVKGELGERVARELQEHAEEELDHANKLVNRIDQLGGVPLLNPNLWVKKANCAYEEPTKFDSQSILNQNISGERCAINVYNTLLSKTKDKDEITYQLIFSILKDEVEHEHDLEKILEDIKTGE